MIFTLRLVLKKGRMWNFNFLHTEPMNSSTRAAHKLFQINTKRLLVLSYMQHVPWKFRSQSSRENLSKHEFNKWLAELGARRMNNKQFTMLEMKRIIGWVCWWQRPIMGKFLIENGISWVEKWMIQWSLFNSNL